MRRPLLPLFLLASAPVLAQGADDCGNAQPIFGEGTFAFDNGSATTDGFPDTLCNQNGFDDVVQDVWFSWTAPVSGHYVLTTCLQTNLDTKLAIYTGGGCGAPALACNDDACAGFQSTVGWDALGGASYLIRVGLYPGGANGGPGSFLVERSVPAIDPSSGHAYQFVAADLDWYAAEADAASRSFNGMPGHLVALNTPAEEVFMKANAWPPYRPNTWLGGFQDLSAPNYAEPAGGWTWVTGEPFTYTNWYVPGGEPNDTTGNENHLGYWPWGQGRWNDYNAGDGTPIGYVVEYEPGPPPPLFCDPAASNSAGTSVTLGQSGQQGPGLIHLEATGGPSGGFGYFLVSATPVDPGLPVSQGFLCLATPQGRYNGLGGVQSLGQFDASGRLQNLTGTSFLGSGFDVPVSLPNPPGGVITPGATWHFQLWYRDGPASNFSDGASVTF